ncbi:MAG: 2Fe-2S iron-sulfur cluster-binding protein [Giesbergeria sp.]
MPRTRAGHSIAHLCWDAALGQSGACRLCTVRIDGRLAAACTTPAAGRPGGREPHART